MESLFFNIPREYHNIVTEMLVFPLLSSRWGANRSRPYPKGYGLDHYHDVSARILYSAI